jgi:hypothetical protein
MGLGGGLASNGLGGGGGGGGAVSTVFGRSGAVVSTSGDYSVAQVTGAAPLASPTFTGTVVLPNTNYSPPSGYLIPSTWKAETSSRLLVGSTATLAALTTTDISFFAIELPTGMTLSNIAFLSGSTAAGTPLNQWFCLYDQNYNALAVTADNTTTAWGTQTLRSLAIGNTYSAGWNVASSFTTTYTGIYYLGIMVKATTVPTLVGGSINGTAAALTPVTGFTDTAHTGLSVPTGAPALATVSGVLGVFPYAVVG